MVGRVRLRRGAGLVEVLPRLDDLRAERAHPRDLGAVGVDRGEHDGRDARARGRRTRRPARSCRPTRRRPAGPGRSSPPPPGRATAIHVPRPLNERIGLTVSTLTMTGHAEPRRQALVDVLRRAGEGRVDPAVGGADRGGFELGDRDHRAAAGAARVAEHNKNARRNRRSVVSAADLHPRHCFRSGAPSSKANDSRRAPPAGYGLIHEFAAKMRLNLVRCPQPVHDAGQPASSGARPPGSRTGSPSSSISIGVPSPIRPVALVQSLDRDRGVRARATRPADHHPGDRRARAGCQRVAMRPGDRRGADGDPSTSSTSRGPNGQPATWRTPGSAPPTWLPWSVPSPSGWNVQSPSARASSRWLNRPSGAVSRRTAWPAVGPPATTSRQRRPRRPSATVQVTCDPSARLPQPATRVGRSSPGDGPGLDRAPRR